MLSNILNNINEGVIVAEESEIMTIINFTAKLIFSVTSEQIIGWKVSDLLKDNDNLLELYYKVLKGEGKQQLLNTKLIVKDEEILNVNFNCMTSVQGYTIILIQPIK